MFIADKYEFRIVEDENGDDHEEINLQPLSDGTLDVLVTQWLSRPVMQTTCCNLTAEQATALKVWLEEQGY